MKYFANLSIKRQIILITMLSNMLALLLTSIFFAATEEKSLRDTMVYEMSIMAKIIGTNIIPSLPSTSPSLTSLPANKILTALSAEPHVTVAFIYDQSGKVFARYKREDVKNSFVPHVQNAGHYFSSNYLELFENIIDNSGQKIGTIYIQSDLKQIHQSFQEYVGILAVILLFSLLVALLLSTKLQTVISRPILHLLRTANTVIQKSDYSIRAQQYGNYELRKLVDVFNEMLVQIQNRDEMLTRHSEDLEEQVKLRTEELSKINLGLEKRVEKLRNAMEATEVANKAQNELLANISHEIRTPMSAVIGMTGLLLETELTPQQRNLLETVHASGETLLSLINDILDFSKMDAGKLELEKQPFNLRDCVETALDLVATKATEKNLELATFFEKPIPVHLSGDAMRLRQVLVNLLNHAVKFTERGEIIVQVSGQMLDNNQIEISFAVKDTGIGIPSNQIDCLFLPFSQVDTSMARRDEGTGLGLTIAAHLCELMGGGLWIKSEVGKGSTSYFTVIAEAGFSEAFESGDYEANFNGKRVLLVDDNHTNRRILSLQMQAWGIQVIENQSGEEALNQIKNQTSNLNNLFDLAILDLQMPGMNGLSLAKEIHKLYNYNQLPLVLLTIGRQPVNFEELGLFSAYLTKPVKFLQLFNCLKNLLTQQSSEKEVFNPTVEMSANLGQEHPLRILLAEDNLTNQKVALLLLSRMGYSADVVENGALAVEAVAQQAYDVILMDIQMPKMDGMEATKCICERWPEQANRPHIVAVTAHAMRGYREKCLEVGMDNYITKPVRPEALADALQRCPRRQVVNEQNVKIAKIQNFRDSEIQKTEKTPFLNNNNSLKTQICTALYELVGDEEPEIINELIQTYLEGGAMLTVELQTAVVEQDPSKLERAAHSLKSSSASLGATILADLCKQLEQQGRAGDLNDAETKVQRVLSEYALVSHQLSVMNGSEVQKIDTHTDNIYKEFTEENNRQLNQLEKEIQNTLFAVVGEDEPEIIADLIQAYHEESVNLINTLREAVTTGNAEILTKAAHSLKSSSGNLGATQLAHLCQMLEQQGQNNELAYSVTTFAQLETVYQQVTIVLQRMQGHDLVPSDSENTIVPNNDQIIQLRQAIKNSLTELLGEYEPEMINDLVQTYQNDASALMKSLREAVTQGDADALALAAHSLKSSSGNLGATHLAELALKLEQKGRTNDMTETPTQLAQLEVEYNLVCLALNQLDEQSSETTPGFATTAIVPSVADSTHFSSNTVTMSSSSWATEATFAVTEEINALTPADTSISKILVNNSTPSVTISLPQPSLVKILVVDDQPYETLLVSTYLQEEGYQVLTANTGTEVLSLVATHSPNIVLSDVMMPGMDGFEVCQCIKASKQSVQTSVVLITSLDGEKDRIKGIQIGADEFLSKPINREELITRVRSLLRYQQAHSQLLEMQKEHLTNKFKRYVSPIRVDEILQSYDKAETALVDKQNRQDAVILFANLRNFITISEQLQPKPVIALLNEFFTMLINISFRYDGTIFNLMSDCLLIGFGVPFPQDDVAEHAVNAATEMQHEFRHLCTSWQERYNIQVGLGISINKGEIIVGNIGSLTHNNYTVIGNTVSVASRLLDLAKWGEIILSESVFNSIDNLETVKQMEILPPVTIKGKSQPQPVYKIG